MSDEIYQQILEWESTKQGLKNIEDSAVGPVGIHLLHHSVMASALRLIMESLEAKPNHAALQEILEELKKNE